MPKFIIEVRDILYQRIGLVENYTNFEGIIRLNAVGSWSMTIPANAPEVTLLQPGNGIIVRIEGQADVAFSGPITKIARNWSESNQGLGSVTVSGVTDDQLLWERVTYPIPANDLDHQTDDRHIFISHAGFLMEYLVRQNCGPDARPERKYAELDVSNSPGLGNASTISTRFDVLGEVVADIANSRGLGFYVRQGLNDRLLFQVFVPADKSELLFGTQYGNLQSYDYEIESPTATRVIFACQGEGKDRYFTDVNFNAGVSAVMDDRDPRITYSANWTEVADVSARNGTLSDPEFSGETFSLDFFGTGIRLYGTRTGSINQFNNLRFDNDPDGRLLRVNGTADTPQQLVHEVDDLARGSHSLLFTSGSSFILDYIEILDDQLTNVTAWDRNSERFYDRRDIPVGWDATHTSLIDPSEGTPADASVYLPMLDQAALEAWDDNGTRASLSISPIDTELVRYGRDYRIGDRVSIDIGGTTFTDILREVRLSDGDDGPRVTPVIGDTQASSTPNLYKTVRRLWTKVRKLEAQ